jgi:UDP-N-acetylmuramoyl-tripeptide--D-alanyl-D-alanine ligase
MKPISPQTLAAWSGGTLAQDATGAMLAAVSTDTRSIPQGALFVALAGENFDAHNFLPQAVQAGAAALMVSREMAYPENAAVIRVPDTLTGLQQLASTWRRDWGGIVVGLTGSNGKTSTKDFTAAILSRVMRVNATKGNLNNHIGLPLTILATGPEHELAVCEMGMNHPGEIAPLAAIAEPDVAIITNVGTAHMENMGSREAIAREKGMLAEAVHANGCVVLNAGDDFTPSIAARCKAKVLTAGFENADVLISGFTPEAAGSRFTLTLPDGQSASLHLPVPGRHMAGNAALAAAAAWHLGVRIEDIAAGLESSALTKGRLQFRTVAGLSILDDTYNCSPDSAVAALDTLAALDCQGRRVAVFGRMAELGDYTREGHLAVGAHVHAAGIPLLCIVGTNDAPLIAEGFLAAGGSAGAVHQFPDAASCADFLRATAAPQDLILIKGSRSSAMEKVIESLAA